jgi:trehalose utilization protein
MDKEIETLEKELNDLLKTKQKLLIPGMMTGGDEESISEKRDNITNTKSKFQKMRKILIDKMLKYTDILLILAKAKNEIDDDEVASNMVTKQSFKDMAKILILYLKQHILNFSELFRKILNDIKRYHEIIMQEVDLCDKLLREAENE